MPLGIFLLWPALHLMYGLIEHRSQKVSIKRRYSGRTLIAFSLFFIHQHYGLEKGIFYWLFAFMAIALCFVQLRIWQPNFVRLMTALSLIGFSITGVNNVFS